VVGWWNCLGTPGGLKKECPEMTAMLCNFWFKFPELFCDSFRKKTIPGDSGTSIMVNWED